MIVSDLEVVEKGRMITADKGIVPFKSSSCTMEEEAKTSGNKKVNCTRKNMDRNSQWLSMKI